MNTTIRRAHEIRREAAAKFGGRPGDYSMKIACEMAKKERQINCPRVKNQPKVAKMKLKEAAKILLRKPSVKLTDNQELVDACRRLHQKGWANYHPAKTSPVVFAERFKANKYTRLAFSETAKESPFVELDKCVSTFFNKIEEMTR